MSKTIHLCIDFLEYYREKGFSKESWAILRENISGLIADLEDYQVPTIHVGYAGCAPGSVVSPGAGELLGNYAACGQALDRSRGERFDLNLSPHDLVAIKDENSAFGNCNLVRYIRNEGVQNIVLSGLYETGTRTSIEGQCLTLTALDFARAGYNVYIVAEATNRFVSSNFSGPCELAERQELHNFYDLDRIKVIEKRD